MLAISVVFDTNQWYIHRQEGEGKRQIHKSTGSSVLQAIRQLQAILYGHHLSKHTNTCMFKAAKGWKWWAGVVLKKSIPTHKAMVWTQACIIGVHRQRRKKKWIHQTTLRLFVDIFGITYQHTNRVPYSVVLPKCGSGRACSLPLHGLENWPTFFISVDVILGLERFWQVHKIE